MSQPAAPAEAGDLCRDCGLCCNGAMFDFLLLEPDELGLLGAGMTRDSTRASAAAQPCPSAGKDGCTIYERRPRACRAYFCRLLRSVESGAVSHQDAKRLIVELLDVVERLEGGLAPGESLASIRKAWQSNPEGWRQGDPSGLALRGQRHLLLTALNRQLDAHFRSPDQQQTHFKVDDNQP